MDNLEKNIIAQPTKEVVVDFSEKNLSKLVERDGVYNTCDHLNEFTDLSHKELALRLIDMGGGDDVGEKLSHFNGLDNEVALKLIESKNGYWVAVYLNRFQGLNYHDIALKIIESGGAYDVAMYLNNFQGLDHREIALKLLEIGKGYALAKNLGNFLPVEKDIILKLLEEGFAAHVASAKFKDEDFDIFDKDIILKFIESGEGGFIVNRLDKFNGLPDKEIALKLISANCGQGVGLKLEEFKELDNEVALKLIESEKSVFVVKNFNRFEGIDYKKIALKLIEINKSNLVYENLDRFQGLDKEVALKLIGTTKKNYNNSAGRPRKDGFEKSCFFETFNGILDQEIALKLLEVEMDAKYTLDELDKFHGLDYEEISEKLFEMKIDFYIPLYSDKFFGPLDPEETAINIINNGHAMNVAMYIEKFPGLNHNTIILKIINAYNNEPDEDGENPYDYVKENLYKFTFSPEELFIEARNIFPNFIANLEDKFPKFAAQISKSPESLIEILMVRNDFPEIERTINDNPFLIEALDDNPRYGSKLILKYREFDITATENIKEVFSIKDDVLREHPEINTESIEFRKLAQEKLSSYKNNPAVLKELEKNGVSLDGWLNYDKQIHFTLGEQEDVKFSDKIKTPIARIRETLQKYQEAIVSVLLDFKKELQSSSVPNPESAELEEKIKNLEIRISEEPDQKRIDGMSKGLISLKSKLKTIRPIDSWVKIQSDVFRLKSMISNIFKFHDACVLTESEIENSKDKTELIKKKDELEKNKLQLKNNLKEFEIFFESYEDKLKELINPSLGEIRSTSLLQELKERIGEDLNHYDTDKNTLNNIFKDEDNDNNDLKDREMRISISSRSPKDLYLGNYCPCCVCIESEYHGEESPIADYVTDLGMQNIVVYDEKKNIPVVVCWSFIGKSSETEDPILVIDNIEANTNYTNNYPEQLKEVITKFIEDYAKTVNVKEIIQGPNNNDLEVFPLGNVHNKLGNLYNRPDGYYLESEKTGNEEENEEEAENEDEWPEDN